MRITLGKNHTLATIGGNGAARLGYAYDKRGRLASETSDLSALVPGLSPQTVTYGYDALGRRSRLGYPDKSTVNYAYDARGRLTGIEDGSTRGAALASYGYDALGRVAHVVRDNGVATRYLYDMAGQLTEIDHRRGSEVLAAARYTLDILGRRTAQTREDGIRETYTYDATSQLIGVDYGTVGAASRRDGFPQSETFAYDAVGNRTQATETANAQSQTTNYTANSLNQYTRIDYSLPATRSSLLAYDANGNLVNDARQTYRYDAQNRLIGVESTTTRAEFFYDARNRCVLRKYYTKTGQGQWVLNTSDSRALTYDSAWNLLTERTLNGSPAGKYIHGLGADEVLQFTRSDGAKLYPLADDLGSTMALISKQGKVIERFRYTAYGQPTALTPSYSFSPRALGPSSYRFLYTGREWLASVQLNDHRYRYYSSGLGRWLATDPIGFEGGLNLYTSLNNNPVCDRDPFGLCTDGEESRSSTSTIFTARNANGQEESWSWEAGVEVTGSMSLSIVEAGATGSIKMSRSGKLGPGKTVTLEAYVSCTCKCNKWVDCHAVITSIYGNIGQ